MWHFYVSEGGNKMIGKYFVLTVIPLLLSIAIIGAEDPVPKYLKIDNSNSLNASLLSKGKIGLKPALLGYDYFYEFEPDKSYSVGWFFPDSLQRALKPVPDAYQKAEDSKNKMLLAYGLSIPAGAFIGAGIGQSNSLYLGIGVVFVLWAFIEDLNGQRDMGHAVYLYNQEIERQGK